METFTDKAGKLSGWVEFYRTQNGIGVHVKTSPEFEEFIRSLGDGNTQTLTAACTLPYGETVKKWTPVDGQPELELYNIQLEYCETVMAGQRARLDMPGYPLEVDGNLGYIPNANVSFLRLKGIGSPDGVKFVVMGTVISKPGFLDLRDRVIRIIKRINSDYVSPLKASGYFYEATTLAEE